MKSANRHGEPSQGGGSKRQGRRAILRTAAAACALSAALLGCSDAKKGVPNVVTDPDDKPGTGSVVSAIDSLVKSNKGTGKGVVTGFLTGEGKSVAKAVLKQAANAAGERRMLTHTEIPLSGATVLIFNAEKPTTLADTTLKTDSTGTYTAVLAEGKYFGFAVYLDLETFQLVTTQIPNMNPIRDTVIKMDTAVAIEDVTAPTVVGVYDAASANSDGVFLVGSVPDANARININFSEPMNRESAKGVVLGKVDTSSSTLALSDTLSGVTSTWSGDSKQLTLNVAELSAGVQYGIIIPVSLKDLAKNPLESGFKAIFTPVAVEEIEAVAFAASASFPEDDGTLKPSQNPSLSFNRPVDVFSVVKNAAISPAVTGFWEVSGSRATFIHKLPFEVGKTYTVTFPVGVKDLGGQPLAKAHEFSFSVVDYEGAAKDASGADRAVALAVESMFNAYTAGDLGRFGAAFHANFRMYQGANVKSKTQFLDNMKADFANRIALVAGIPAPVFDIDSAACRDRVQRWKVAAQGDTSAWLWVQSYTNPGSVPTVWGKDRKEIDRSKLIWDRAGPRFTYEGKVYGFAPDFSMFGSSMNMDAAIENARFMADVMAKTSTIVLAPVKMEQKETFLVDGGMSLEGDTARLAVKMTNSEKYNRGNFDFDRGCGGSLEHVRYEILKFMLVYDGSRWLVLTIVAPDEEINREDFDKTVDVRQDFGAVNVKPIVLRAPINGQSNVAAAADGSVKFEFDGVVHDSVGGYLVGLAEDPKFTGGRPPYGVLLFVKASSRTGGREAFTLDASGKVIAGEASALLRRVQDLMLPGWERTLFEYTLAKLYDQAGGFAGVYNWKAIAVRDTSAAQFLQNGFKMSRYFGESDFGGNRGYFAVKGFPSGDFMARLDTLRYVQPPVNGGTVGFGDMDQDGVPDFMEQKYGSDMRDRNSFPDFRVDTDGDKLCDFLEKKLDPTGKDSLADKAGDAAQIKAEIEALAKLVPAIIVIDSDGDGFPDDVEEMLGFNPRDPANNPGTKVRASLPLGGFAGKVQMGSNTNSVSLKLYQDSAKALWVAFTAYIGRDTVVDTSRANFNDMMGEVQMALRLPANGPDSGRALLLRGRYDAFQSLLMGPVDMIQAPPRNSVNFGSGPYVGQFAASGRGEDVSRFLPGNTGTTGPVGPVVPPPTLPGYRPPPAGTSEGSKIVFAGPRATLIDDFGDTVAVIGNLAWRGQPDGSFEIWGESRVGFTNGTKRTEVGGRLYLAGDGWVLDGHVFQSVDSAGFHRDIPGQHCFRARKEELAKSSDGIGLAGSMGGWIAQDKSGSGFQNPVTTDTSCVATRTCPPPTGGTFSIPYMGGLQRFQDILKSDTVGKAGRFHVSMGGVVFLGTFDSAHVSAAKFPWCNQVVLTLEPLPLVDGATDVQKAEYERHKSFLSGMSNGLIIVLEDQFRPGIPARIEKARDYLGGIQVNVLMAELRPTPMDYGREGMQCGGTTVPNCPVGQICPPPGGTSLGIDPATTPFYNGTAEIVKTALGVSGNAVLLVRDRNSAGERLVVDLGTVKKDDMRNAVTASLGGSQGMTVVFLGQDGGSRMFLKENLPIVAPFGPAGDSTSCPAGQTCPPPGGNGPLFLQVEINSLVAALATVDNRVQAVRDSAGQPVILGLVTVDPTSLKFDEGMRAIVGNELGKPDVKLAFLAEGDVKTPMVRGEYTVVLKLMGPPPGGTTPTDTTKPPVYRGTQANLLTVLERTGWVAKLMPPPPELPVDVKIASASLASDGQVFFAYEEGNPAKLFVFMGDRMDPAKPAMSQDGKPVVAPKPVTAGP